MKRINNKLYYIKEVSELTGISEQLIRKWENRYQIVKPERLDNGYRIYTYEDIVTLKSLKNLRDQNYSLKDAVNIIAEKQVLNQKTPKEVTSSPYVADLIKAGTIYDEEKLMTLLNQANQQYGLDLFLKNTVQPFLKEIGRLWQEKAWDESQETISSLVLRSICVKKSLTTKLDIVSWDESQETISSLVVRDFLTQIDRSFSNNIDDPLILGFCLPNENHEIPLQILLLQLEIRGWRTIRIAASPKFSSIEKLIERIKPKKVLLSASSLQPFQRDSDLLDKLDKIANKQSHISLYIGGSGVWKYTDIVKPKHLMISYTIDDIIKN